MAHALPLTYAEKVLIAVMRDGASFAEIRSSLAPLLLFGTAPRVASVLTVREEGRRRLQATSRSSSSTSSDSTCSSSMAP